MPTHPDAIGYLTDLANEINEPWFRMACDLASIDGMSTLDQLARDTLYALYTGGYACDKFFKTRDVNIWSKR